MQGQGSPPRRPAQKGWVQMTVGLAGAINRMGKRKMTIIIFVLFVASAGIRFFLSDFPRAIRIYPDELRYWDIASSLLNKGAIEVYNTPVGFYKILYSVLLMPVFLLPDAAARLTVIAAVNSAVMSSLVFPVYLLSRKIFGKNAYVLLCIAIALIVPDFSYTMTIFSENLYYPLSLWLCYAAFLFFSEERHARKTVYALLCGVLTFLAYMTKEVALYFLIAFVLTLVYSLIRDRGAGGTAWKRKLLYAAAYVSVFAVLFLAARTAFSMHIGGGYEHQINVDFLSTNSQRLFLVYAVLYSISMTLIGFMFFPLVVPILKFGQYGKAEKELIVFVLSSLLIAIVTVAFTVTLPEDFGKGAIRQHFRYYAALFLPLAVLTIRSISDGRPENGERRKAISKGGAAVLALFLGILLVGTQFPDISVDGVALSVYRTVFNKLMGRIPSLGGPASVLVIKALVILFLGAFSFLVFGGKAKRRAVVLLSAVMIIGIQLGNSALSYRVFRTTYVLPAEIQQELLRLNERVSGLSGAILVDSKPFDSGLDTYITSPNAYFMSNDRLLELQNGKGYIDLTQQKLDNFFTGTYPDIQRIDYIITIRDIALSPEHAEEIPVEGVTLYHLYRNIDIHKLYCSSP